VESPRGKEKQDGSDGYESALSVSGATGVGTRLADWGSNFGSDRSFVVVLRVWVGDQPQGALPDCRSMDADSVERHKPFSVLLTSIACPRCYDKEVSIPSKWSGQKPSAKTT
jgi:hypothetical protein